MKGEGEGRARGGRGEGEESRRMYQKLSNEIELPNWTDNGNDASISSPTSGIFPPCKKVKTEVKKAE